MAEGEQVKAEGPEQWEARIQELEAGGLQLEESIRATDEQLRELRAGVLEMDGELQGRMGEILERLPDSTPKGALDEILKMATPKRTQLLENVSKLTIYLAQLRKKKGAAAREIEGLEWKIREHTLNVETAEWASLLQEWAKVLLDAERRFADLRMRAGRLHAKDQQWTKRMDPVLGTIFPRVGGDLFKPSREAMNMSTCAEDIGRSVGSNLYTGGERLFGDDPHRHALLYVPRIRESAFKTQIT